jgi:universal stress protein A
MRFGRPVETILIAAQKLKSNLIVIGTHGHTGLAHMLLGSVAERIARHATCPVLIVR